MGAQSQPQRRRFRHAMMGLRQWRPGVPWLLVDQRGTLVVVKVLLPLLLPLFVLAGCDAGGRTLVVEVVTDLRPGAEFVTVRGVLSAPGRPDITIPAVLGADFVNPVRLAEFDGLVDGNYDLVVTASDVAGDEVVRRTVSVDLRENLAVTVALSRSCRDVVCPAAGDGPALTTCVSGRCVDPACSELSVDRCEPGACTASTASADCTMGSACAAGLCVEGGCHYIADDSACMEGQVCSPTTGCIDVVGPPDAGMDASVPPSDTGADAAEDAGPACDTEVMLASIAADADSGSFSGSPFGTLVIVLGPSGERAVGDEDPLPSGYSGVREFRPSNDSDFDLVVAPFMDGSDVTARIKVTIPSLVGGGRPGMPSQSLVGTTITMVRREVTSFSFTSGGGTTDYDATSQWEFWGCFADL